VIQPSNERCEQKQRVGFWARFAISSLPMMIFGVTASFLWSGADLLWAIIIAAAVVSAIEFAIRIRIAFDADATCSDAKKPDPTQASSLP